MGEKAYFIQYKFIIPKTIKHSSYTYQKLFRALYGYTQVVNKSNGKKYTYHREGVLSNTPYLRTGKNCVVIEPGALQKLLSFFRSGKNPTHNWQEKGNWKAVYYMNEKTIPPEDAAKALENLLQRTRLEGGKGQTTLYDAVVKSQEQAPSSNYRGLLLGQAKPIMDSNWFSSAAPTSKKLTTFKEAYNSLKQTT